LAGNTAGAPGKNQSGVLDLLKKYQAAKPKAADTPTAAELLNRYAETQDKIQRSFLIKFEASSVHSGVVFGGSLRANNQKTSLSGELRLDGARICYRYYRWGQIEQKRLVSKENASYYSYLWDGRTCFQYQRHPESEIPAGMVRIDQNPSREQIAHDILSLDYMGGGLLGFLYGRYERIDKVLRDVTGLSVRQKTEQVGESDCYVIDAQTQAAKYTLWIDPAHGCNIAKAVVHWTGNLPAYDMPNWTGKTAFNSVENICFKEITDLWVPIEADITLNRNWPNGEWTRQSWHHKVTEIVLNPNHDALRSFIPDDVKNGVVATVSGIDGKYTWQDGCVVDKDGKLILDRRSTEPNLSAEPKPELPSPNHSNLLDLLRKYQTTQTKVENQSSKERIVHFPEDRSLGNLLI